MIYVFINDNKVVDIKDCEESDLLSIRQNFQQVYEISYFQREPKIGWLFDGKICHPDLPSVTPRQLRQALIMSGINLGQVQTALYSLPHPIGALATAEWEYSISFNRRRPLVVQVGAMFGWNEDQLDDLWRLAGSLV